MKRYLLLLLCCAVAVLNSRAQQVIVVEKGNAQSLLNAISKANELNASQDAPQLYILIPDGLYDLGERVLTRLTGHHVALVGQSMTGTVIQNKPDIKNEGLSKTARTLSTTMLPAQPDVPPPCTTRAPAPSATACGCCPTRTPTIPTTTSANFTSRTPRFTAPSTLSAAMATYGSSVAFWSPRSAHSTAAGAMLSPPPRRRRPSGATSSTIVPLRILFPTSSMHEAGAARPIASGSIPLC